MQFHLVFYMQYALPPYFHHPSFSVVQSNWIHISLAYHIVSSFSLIIWLCVCNEYISSIKQLIPVYGKYDLEDYKLYDLENYKAWRVRKLAASVLYHIIFPGSSRFHLTCNVLCPIGVAILVRWYVPVLLRRSSLNLGGLETAKQLIWSLMFHYRIYKISDGGICYSADSIMRDLDFMVMKWCLACNKEFVLL